MKNRYKLTVIIFLSILIASCKKVIDLNLSNTTPQLVIEGNLTDQSGTQTVTISKSVTLDNTNTFPAVSGATVKIIDNSGAAHVLTEHKAGTYTIDPYLGRYNQKYTLQVLVNGQTYTAVSTLPNRVLIDSLGLTAQNFGRNATKTVAVYYQDPPNETNQYRFILYVNGVQVKDVFARNDQFSNGRYVQVLLYEDDITLNTGDRVDVEMQCIDAAVYTYWYTFSQQQSNAFSSTTPSNPPTNFNTGNVLGYFSAHTTQRKSVIVP